MKRRSFVAFLAASVLCVAAPCASDSAWADGPHGPWLEVTLIHALKSDAGASVDPSLRDLPLGEKPFNRYNVYKLVDRKRLPFEVGKPQTLPLPNGRTLQAALTGITVDKNEKRYAVDAAIGDPGRPAFLKNLQVTVSENEPFFVGGQSYKGGTLFLELSVRP